MYNLFGREIVELQMSAMELGMNSIQPYSRAREHRVNRVEVKGGRNKNYIRGFVCRNSGLILLLELAKLRKRA